MTSVALTPEYNPLGICDCCGSVGTAVVRFLLAVGDGCGFSPTLCTACAEKGRTATVAIVSPEAPKRPPVSRSRRRAVARQEREMATRIGGKTQKASGALHYAKGDVLLRGILRGEMKSTNKKSFTIKREVLDKIRSECQGLEKPFVQVRFINPHTLATEDDWVLIPLQDWDHATSQHR